MNTATNNKIPRSNPYEKPISYADREDPIDPIDEPVQTHVDRTIEKLKPMFLTVKLTTFTTICILSFDSSINSFNLNSEQKKKPKQKEKKKKKKTQNQTKPKKVSKPDGGGGGDEMGYRRLSVVGCCRRNGEGARGFSFDGLSSKEERALKRGETRRWAWREWRNLGYSTELLKDPL
jgi:hypothetical protein